MEVLIEVLEPLVEVATPEPNTEPKLSFYVSFHSKLLLSHLPGTLVVFVSKLVHIIILEKTLSNKINNIMLSIGMPSLT